MKIAIRADASTRIGHGHIKRCLSLSHALKIAGAEVRFFARHIDIDPASLTNREGFELQVIGSGPLLDERQDAHDFLEAVKDFGPAWIIVDHYGLSARWHRQIRSAITARLAAIDDLADRDLDVDLLVDHTYCPDHQVKYAHHVKSGIKIIGGPQYGLLGPAYADAPRYLPQPAVSSIGIFMGGTDENNLSALAYEACRNGAGFNGRIEIATTASNRHIIALQALATSDSRLLITLDQPDLAAFFCRHDLQIGAGGGASWERCCIGAPTIGVIAADNQIPVILPLGQIGVLWPVASIPPTCADLTDAVKRLLGDAELRSSLSARSRELVDGLGTVRIAEYMCGV